MGREFVMSLCHIFLVCFDLPKSTKLLLIWNARFFVLFYRIIRDTECGSADCKTIVYFVYERKVDERSDKLDKLTNYRKF